MLLSKIKTGAILLLVAGAMALGAGLLGQQAANKDLAVAPTLEGPNDSAGEAASRSQLTAIRDSQGAVDRLGDPLPPGALLRLGTIRLRHKDHIASVAFAPDGRFVATGGGDGDLRLWDPVTGREQRRLEGHEDTPAAIAVSRDGKLLAAATVKTVHLWDVATGKLLQSIPADTTRPIENGISFLGKVPLAFSADGALLAYVTAEPSVRVWDVLAGKERFHLKGHATPAEVLGFSGDGKTLIAAIGSRTADGEVRRWDTTTGEERASLRVPLRSARSSTPFALSPDGRTLALEAVEEIRRPLPGGGMQLSHGYKVRLWDLETLQERALTTQPDVIWCVTFSADGKKVAGAQMGGLLVVWDFATGQELQRCSGARTAPNRTAATRWRFPPTARFLQRSAPAPCLACGTLRRAAKPCPSWMPTKAPLPRLPALRMAAPSRPPAATTRSVYGIAPMAGIVCSSPAPSTRCARSRTRPMAGPWRRRSPTAPSDSGRLLRARN